jgi:hypothetical protein
MVHVVVIRTTGEDEACKLDNEEGRTLDVSRKILAEEPNNEAGLEACNCVDDDPAAAADSVM